MPKFVTTDEAVSCIPSGAIVGINAFLTQLNPVELTLAVAERYRRTGAPSGLKLYTSASFGVWDSGSPAEELVRCGAVASVTQSFYSSSPDTAALVTAGKLEAYNLPFGVMSHMVRAAAGGHKFYITDIGKNLFIEPETGGSKLNSRSSFDWVESVELDGRRFLKYRTPEFDAVLIKASAADRFGNVSFEDESMTLDALSYAQAAKKNHGLVIVQAARIITGKHRPWNVIIPGALVDYICVCPGQSQIFGELTSNPMYSGDEFVEPEKIAGLVTPTDKSEAAALIASRAARELRSGQIVNLGVGIPTSIAVHAAKLGLLSNLTLTVESGAFGGMPASGAAFGSSIGAMSICNSSQIFDFYDGGGLDAAFLGFLEADAGGNVNAHQSPNKLSGIGGFANITQHTPKVVFCGTFTSGGLEISRKNGRLSILREGRYRKFVQHVNAVSFSSKNAREYGQEILYITERCVFRLAENGLELIEAADGIDVKRDILNQLPFEVINKLHI